MEHANAYPEIPEENFAAEYLYAEDGDLDMCRGLSQHSNSTLASQYLPETPRDHGAAMSWSPYDQGHDSFTQSYPKYVDTWPPQQEHDDYVVTYGDYEPYPDETSLVPSSSYEAAPPAAEESQDAADGDPDSGSHVCLRPNCDATPFRRKADLERHYRHMHTADGEKQTYFCDYSNCHRKEEAFHRMDHCRDHYRAFHLEDLIRKKGEKADWYMSRHISPKWWRCSKCLQRNKVAVDNWVCAGMDCQTPCDPKRVELRGF